MGVLRMVGVVGFGVGCMGGRVMVGVVIVFCMMVLVRILFWVICFFF